MTDVDPSMAPVPGAAPSRPRWLVWGLAVGVLMGFGWAVLRASRPQTAAAQLAYAERQEQELGRAAARLDASAERALRDRVAAAYRSVWTDFEASPALGAEARRKLAALHQSVGRLEDAVTLYREAARTDPTPPHAVEALETAARLAESIDPLQACEVLRELARVFPAHERSPHALLRVAEVLDRKATPRVVADALAAYLEVASRFPKATEAPRGLIRAAELAGETGDWKRAASLLERVAREYPESPEAPAALRRRAEILETRLKDPASAAKVLDQLARRYPKSKEARFARSQRDKIADAAVEGAAREYMGRHYGGNGGLIYDPTAGLTAEQKALYREIGAQKLDVRRVVVDATLDPAAGQVQFRCLIDLTHGATPRRDLLFRFGQGFGPLRVRFNGATVRHALDDVGRLKLFLPDQLERDTPCQLELTYTAERGESASPVEAMWIGKDAGYAMVDRGWYPMNVYGDLFEFEGRFVLPKGLRAVSVGMPRPPRSVAGGIEHAWRSDRPVFAAYWAYASFHEQQSMGSELDLRLLTTTARPAGRALLATVKDVLAVYGERFGPYPYKKLWVVELPLPPRIAGLAPPSMLWLNTRQFVRDQPPVTVVAHELAHQWFGNLVPVGLFGARGYSMWLSEGFASHAETRYIEARQGAAASQAHLAEYQRLFLDLTRRFSEPPLRAAEGGGPGYLGAAYMKGCWVLHMLRRQLGDKVFDAALRAYLHDYADRVASVDQVKRLFEAASGQDLSTFFEDWVDGLGCVRYDIEDVSLRKRGDGGGLKQAPWVLTFSLRQRATKVVGPAGSGPPAKRPPFRTPVGVLVEGGNARARHRLTVTPTVNPTPIRVELGWRPRRIVIDESANVLKVPGDHNEHRLAD